MTARQPCVVPDSFMPIGQNTSFEELCEAAAIELDELRRRTVTLLLRPLQAWALMGNLQLALARERNKGMMRESVGESEADRARGCEHTSA